MRAVRRAALLLTALGFAVGTLRLARRGRRLTGIAARCSSPLAAAGHGSFAAHMAEHELLMVAAAPLLVLAEPVGPWLWAVPGRGARHACGRALAAPVARRA